MKMTELLPLKVYHSLWCSNITALKVYVYISMFSLQSGTSIITCCLVPSKMESTLEGKNLLLGDSFKS